MYYPLLVKYSVVTLHMQANNAHSYLKYLKS